MALTDKLSAIANAIRAKTGKTDPMALDAMPTEIEGISVGGSGTIEPLTVTENGTYTPPEGVDGYSPVEVMVTPEPSDIDALIDRSITEVTSGAAGVGERAFQGCTNLTSASFSNATVINGYAFSGCDNLTNVSFPNVKTIGNNVFYSCDNLTSVSFPNVTTVDSYAFQGCTNLTSASFPNVTTFSLGSFDGCKKLESVDFPNATAIGWGTSGGVFSNCLALKTVNLPLVYNAGPSAFVGCFSLQTIKLPSLKMFGNTYNATTYAFEACTALKVVDLPKFTRVGGYDFSKCYSLTAVLLRNETVCSLYNINAFNACYHFHGTVNETYNPEGLKDGYIYVPRSLVDSYKAATNWSTFADQFRALEDYTVDGTITGELDETKM